MSPKWVSPSFALDKFPRVPWEISSSSFSAGGHIEPIMARLQKFLWWMSLKPNPFNEICLFRLPSRHKTGQGSISCCQYPDQATQFLRESQLPTLYQLEPISPKVIFNLRISSKAHFFHLPHTWSQFLRCILLGAVWVLCSGSPLSSSWAASSAGAHKN